jgi:hypothetical protein
MSLAMKLAFLLLSIGAFGAYTAKAPNGAGQSAEDGNPPPPKP